MSRFAFAQFCDDVRFEVGEKISLMGIYGSDVFLPRFPATLSKFCFVAYCGTPFDSPIEKLEIEVVVNGERIFFLDFPQQILDEIGSRKNDVEDPLTIRTYGANSIIENLSLEKESIVRLNFIADGVKLPAARVHVKQIGT